MTTRRTRHGASITRVRLFRPTFASTTRIRLFRPISASTARLVGVDVTREQAGVLQDDGDRLGAKERVEVVDDWVLRRTADGGR